ncbi:hypothetical protein [Pseudomonas chlororaphis]|uniref:hypothetical protein n=1 Tax=Pseudomonas chlororaphis TaxID=587753 RepID=UPI002368E10B|nr:hypothetical protein [Pseudomonas chlororaphis]WDH37418.1 hypothetical protein PUP62_11520 [Pseudomonas chlororaphis]WDH43505.1 hypothetical protein PUP51_11525 [Pseudomonas chlororaphis]
MAKKLEFWGMLGTVVYLIIITTTVVFKFDSFIKLGLNELGDFLAGVFGPIAFLWLVLGFLQQGRELKLSSDALRLQADELRASVEQQSHMVEAQKLSLENHERSLDPLLMLQSIKGTHDEDGEFYYQFKVINKGAYCEDVVISVSSEDFDFSLTPEPLYDDTYTTFVISEGSSDRVSVTITYRRVSGNTGFQRFQLNKAMYEDASWYSISKIRSQTV